MNQETSNAIDREIKIKQLEFENNAIRSALIVAKQHIAAEFGFENWRIEQVNKLASAAMPNKAAGPNRR